MRKLFLRLLRIELVLIFLVIVAGSVVRMSGSGMGCPDWPKCFGLIIPPTDAEQVKFHPNTEYAKGQMIVMNDTLWKAGRDLITSDVWNNELWEAYTKHDYAVFNPVHTWIEYINRLFGALSGVPMLALVFLSLFYLRRFSLITFLAFAAIFMLGFEAWLGKLVVDGNLIPGQITMHMLGAMVIIALLLMMMALLQRNVKNYLFDKKELTVWLSFALLLTLGQIVLGTQVREQVDELYRAYDGGERGVWLGELGITFYIHRSFSILLLLVNGYLWNKNRKAKQTVPMINVITVLLLVELFTGVILAYMDFPPAVQPVHLVLAMIIYALQFFLWFHNQLARVKDPESEAFLARQSLTSTPPALQSSIKQEDEVLLSRR
jgi:heme a synthase